jgi:exopolyphosphatase/pppGpp-phosphohydrolase
MRTRGVSRRDYERLSAETKSKLEGGVDEIKLDLRRYGFSLRFLGLSGRWKDITAPVFLAQTEEHYQRQIMGSKWVTATKRRDLVDRISELYGLASKASPEGKGLENWLA